MKEDNRLDVFFGERHVGTLALTETRKAAFAYSDSWLKNGFSISPFSLPLKEKVFVPQKDYFGGLFGVFADSLPDAWGNLLLNRILQKNGLDPGKLTVLERLAIIGTSGMGVLTYHPARAVPGMLSAYDLDQLAMECREILHSKTAENLDQLYQLGGTSGGARPKILVDVDQEPWIIKFPASGDGEDSGIMEYDYAQCACKCGIQMSDTRLFPSKICAGYFGTRRFDRVRERDGRIRKVHMLTAAALLELDFGQPSLDYHSLMKLTSILSGGNRDDLENMYRRMCFNVFAHNRDDHSKNFTWICQEADNSWRLAPAYDLTYSNTYYGEHTTTVDGNGRDPGKKELIAVGVKAGLKKKRCAEITEEIERCVKELLAYYCSPHEQHSPSHEL